MKFIHNVSIVDKPQRREVLSSLGIKFFASEPPVSPLLIFYIAESDPAWEQLCELIPRWNVEDGKDPNDLGWVGTKFSKKDLEAASFLQIFAWHHGYPMPDDDFGYLKATYDLTDYCTECGIGKHQIAPFRMKGEPKWGKRHILQLNWVFDEFFVLPEVWERVFQPFGVGCRPVIHHRSGQELQTVVQIDIAATAASTLQIAENQPSEVCTSCDRRKYLPISKGPFPSLVEEPTEPMLKTQEYFGSGASAWRAVIVSSALFQVVKEHKVKGVDFIPCDQL